MGKKTTGNSEPKVLYQTQSVTKSIKQIKKYT